MIRIRFEDGEGESFRTFRESTVVVGRSRKCDLSMPAAKGLSRFHYRLTVKDGTCVAEDLGSRNGTFVNDRPLTEPQEIREGDTLKAGDSEVRVVSVRGDEQTEELVVPCLHCGHLFSSRTPACPRCGTDVERKGRTRSIGPNTFPGYRLVRKIGSGGMGIVFLADDSRTGNQVALKVLRPHLARDVRYLVRFIEEVRMLTSLRDDGIVRVFGRGSEEGLHYLTMELVRGPSAREAMRAEGFLPWQDVARIAWQAARALNAAHQQAGIVHGDVKPGNFLLANGKVKLCDFGLAREGIDRRTSADRAAEDERRGTAAYAAPERFGEGGRPTVCGDMYSLGVSIFQMATGHLPFRGASVAAIRDAHRRQPIPSMRTLRGDISPGLELLTARLLAKTPAGRFADYPALIGDLSLLVN